MTDGIKPQCSTPGAATRQQLCVSLSHPLFLPVCLRLSFSLWTVLVIRSFQASAPLLSIQVGALHP